MLDVQVTFQERYKKEEVLPGHLDIQIATSPPYYMYKL